MSPINADHRTPFTLTACENQSSPFTKRWGEVEQIHLLFPADSCAHLLRLSRPHSSNPWLTSCFSARITHSHLILYSTTRSQAQRPLPQAASLPPKAILHIPTSFFLGTTVPSPVDSSSISHQEFLSQQLQRRICVNFSNAVFYPLPTTVS